jgi:hypothetical protein
MNPISEWREITASRRHAYFYALLILCALFGNDLRNSYNRNQIELRAATSKAKSELARFTGLTGVEAWNAPVPR